MKKLKECPLYIWIFSFLALFALCAATILHFMASIVRRKFDFDLWLKFWVEMLLDWVILFMLTYIVLALILGHFMPGLWESWLGFLTAYILGIFPAARMYHWRKAHL